MENADPAGEGGAGGDGIVAGTTSLSHEPADVKINPYHRARDLSIAAGLIYKHRPTPRELEIITGSWASVGDLDGQLLMLMIEATAPSRECADPAWFWALTCEEDTAAIVAARCYGWMPPELIGNAAAAFAAVVHGRLRVKGVSHAAA